MLVNNTNITVDRARCTTYVEMAANADELIPMIGRMALCGHGEAQVQLHA